MIRSSTDGEAARVPRLPLPGGVGDSGLPGLSWRMSVIVPAIAAISAALGLGNQVIAAPVGIDQRQLDSTPRVAAEATLAFDTTQIHDRAATSALDDVSSLTPGEWLVAGLGLLIVLAFFIGGGHRLRGAPRRPEMFPPLIAFALAFAMFAAGLFGAAIASRIWDIPFSADAEHSVKHLAQLSIGLYALQAIVAVMYARQRIRSLRLEPGKGARPSRLKAAIGGVAALLLSWPVLMVAGLLAGLMVGAPDDPIAHASLRILADAPVDAWFIAFVLIVTLITPLMEEILYRGLLQESLVKAGLPRWVGILIVSAAFAWSHNRSVDPHAMASLLVFSIALGWAYEKTGRLTAPIVMHMLFNAGNLIIARMITS